MGQPGGSLAQSAIGALPRSWGDKVAVRDLTFQVGIFLVALLAGMLGAFPIFVLGLFVPGYAVLPLTVLLAGLTCALGAGWTANVLRPDASTSDLKRIVAATEAVALLLVVLLFALTFGLAVAWPFPASPLVFTVLALALAGSVSSWRFRKTQGSLRRDALLTIVLIVLALLAVVLTVSVTCSLTSCVP